VGDRTRYRGALLGALVGDGLGAPFEGHAGPVPSAEVAAVAQGSSTLRFTDDTAMTVALAGSLLRMDGIDEDDLARAFADQWALAPRRGYSSTTARLLATVHDGVPWRDALRGLESGRASNGAAMRVAPAALHAAGRADDTLEVARRSAGVTHTHPGAVAGARVQALAVALALGHPTGRGIDRAEFVARLRAPAGDPPLAANLALAAGLAARGDPAEIAARIGTGILAAESVPAAVCAFLSHPASFPDAVILAVRLGGDTDTIAAMTGALSGALLGESAIPAGWIERAESAAPVRHLADELFFQTQRRARLR